jgi:AcrR family transcriptional regulator
MPATLPELRRTPRQERSLQLIERVLDAADGLLATGDSAALTTTRIAAEAGVSVGALYQYFPDTGAIVAAVAVRHIESSDALMAAAAAEAEAAGWPDPVSTLIDLFAARWRSQPGYRSLWAGPQMTHALREADRAGKEALAEGLRSILLTLGLVADGERLPLACVVAVYTCDALLQEAFRRDPDGDPEILDETKKLLGAYLDNLAAEQGKKERR